MTKNPLMWSFEVPESTGKDIHALIVIGEMFKHLSEAEIKAVLMFCAHKYGEPKK